MQSKLWTLVGLVLLAAMGARADDVMRISLFKCEIDKSAFDAPTTLVFPKVKIMLNENGQQELLMVTDSKKIIPLDAGDSSYAVVIDGSSYSSKGIHVLETHGIEYPTAKAWILFDSPKLKYNCESSMTDDSVMYHALNVSAKVSAFSGANMQIMEKNVDALTCRMAYFLEDTIRQPHFYCFAHGPLNARVVFESLKVSDIVRGSIGQSVVERSAGRLKCVKTNVVNPNVVNPNVIPHFTCILED